METPTPVNLSALQSILAKSKQVMKKVDAEKPIVSKGTETVGLTESVASTTPMYSERDEREPMYENYVPKPASSLEVQDYTEEQVLNSKLPPAIKEAMLKKHIPKPKFTASKFSLDDVSNLIEKKPAQQQIKTPSVPLRENTTPAQSNGILVDPSVLKNMIKEAVAEYFQERYEKNITESAIKKTISVLLKEGKINPKK